MESFDQLVEQYTPMIHKIIKSLCIYKNQEEFYQTGLIALWEANEGFNPKKGTFTNYAYTYIKCKLLDEITHCNTLGQKNVYQEEEYWETVENQEADRTLEADLLRSYCHHLTKKETKWVLATFLHGLSVREIAEAEKVTASAVKQWQSGAIKKLREQLQA